MTLYLNKYRSEGNRLPGYDYTKDGEYFITIREKNNSRVFGEVVDQKMILNEYGKIVERCWYDLPSHYKNLILSEFIVMPNHVHMIMIIKNKPNIKKHGVSEFVRAIKTFSSMRINKLDNTPGEKHWQRDFWDVIIKNDTHYLQIKQYIINNPKNWDKEK